MSCALINWFKQSNRWKHLLGGALLGMVSNGWYMAILMGAATGGALEFKDKAYGGAWDWIDFSLTVAGAAIGMLTVELGMMIFK